MNWLLALLEAIKAGFNFGEKITPPDEIRVDNHAIKREKLTANQMISIYDRDYIRLRDHWEIDIATDVNFVHDGMDEDDKKELIELLTRRITRYRERFPIRFRKWLKSKNPN